MSVIIPKWTKIPYEEVKEYKTIEDNQKDMQISIFEGENKYLKYNKYLDKFTLIDLPKKPKGQVICVVKFSIDENSILTVKAYEKSEGKSKQVSIKKKNQLLTDKELELEKKKIENTKIINMNENEKKKYFQIIEKKKEFFY